ncbi:hypothetical protein [Campylobacter phage CJLB-14]|nr:hypothetical protein [Campylobacter phage CJLB-14]
MLNLKASKFYTIVLNMYFRFKLRINFKRRYNVNTS